MFIYRTFGAALPLRRQLNISIVGKNKFVPNPAVLFYSTPQKHPSIAPASPGNVGEVPHFSSRLLVVSSKTNFAFGIGPQCHRHYATNKQSKIKKRKSKDNQDKDSSDDETDAEGEDFETDWDHEKDEEIVEDEKKDWKDLRMNVPSLRIDAILSAGLGISRKKVEDAFLNAKLRCNNKKVLKKSKQVSEGDVLDLMKDDKMTKQDGEHKVLVMRVVVQRINEETTSSDKIPVKLRRWKHLELPGK